MSKRKQNIIFWYFLITSLITTGAGITAIVYFLFWLYSKIN